ncbi:MAG: 2-oxoglutarate oxidoreductase [Chloroflexota bacterium]|nr:MAG: 2-oxoglutarate oxidoreductase [Chloroflexota bacterium]
MQKIFERVETLRDVPTQWCAGCGYGIVQRLIAEVVHEMKLTERTVLSLGVGCHTNAIVNFNFDVHGALHGRAPAVATGIKRARPDLFVFTLQGDGDLAAIGTAEIIHAAMRGERFTTIFMNNAIYGQTGGQMAPTTLVGQVTSTSPYGRDVAFNGQPLRISNMIAQIPGAAYVTRTSVHTVANVNKTKKLIRKAFEVQEAGLGFSLVEIITNCPSNWKMSALESIRWLEENMLPIYPLGDLKTPDLPDR